jgi:hypothetical protein
MLTNRILAFIAFTAFIGFFAVIVWKVPRVDLVVVVLIGVGLAGYDLWRLLLRRRS